jgi:hypothetical protein
MRTNNYEKIIAVLQMSVDGFTDGPMENLIG